MRTFSLEIVFEYSVFVDYSNDSKDFIDDSKKVNLEFKSVSLFSNAFERTSIESFIRFISDYSSSFFNSISRMRF